MSNFEITGLEELVSKMEHMGKQATRIQKEALETGAEAILQEMKATAAWADKSGDLRGAIVKKTIKRGKAVEIGVWGLPYGYMLEYGTSKMPAKPWLSPAFNAKKGEAISIVRRKIVEGLKL